MIVLVLLVAQIAGGTLPNFQQRVVPSLAEPNSFGGHSVAITPSGLRAVLGAPGNFYASQGPYSVGFLSVYDRVGSTWTETTTLSGSESTTSLGEAVGIAQDGLTIIGGCSRCNSKSGSIYVFEQIGSSWSEGIALVEADATPNVYLGNTVAISQDGKTIASTTQRYGAGGAVVFVKISAETWDQQGARLMVDASPIYGFGGVALSGNGTFLVLGVYSNVHSLYFFKRNSSLMWYQSGPAITPGPTNTDEIADGAAMTADGTFVVTGGYSVASVFKLSDDATTYLLLQELIAPGSHTRYGARAIAISSLGNHIIVGDTSVNVDTAYTRGGAFIFKLLSDRASFGLVGNITMPFFNATLGDKSFFGVAVAVSDHGNFLVGAEGEDGYTGESLSC